MSAQLPSIYSLPEWYTVGAGKSFDPVRAQPFDTRTFMAVDPVEQARLRAAVEAAQKRRDELARLNAAVEKARQTAVVESSIPGEYALSKDRYSKAVKAYNAYGTSLSAQPMNRAVPVTDEVPIEELLTQSMPSEAANLASLGLYSDDLESMVQARRK